MFLLFSVAIYSLSLNLGFIGALLYLLSCGVWIGIVALIIYLIVGEEF